MKIGQLVIQERNISANTEEQFRATYKGLDFHISETGDYGPSKFEHLRRYSIYVADRYGNVGVSIWGDFHTMKDAIRKALKEAGLWSHF